MYNHKIQYPQKTDEQYSNLQKIRIAKSPFWPGHFSLFQTVLVICGRVRVPSSNFTKGSDSSMRSALRRFRALILVKVKQPETWRG